MFVKAIHKMFWRFLQKAIETICSVAVFEMLFIADKLPMSSCIDIAL